VAAADSTSLVEGRIAVAIPPHWLVQRITAGPGSRRVQVSSGADADTALHITQSYAPETTLAEAAEVLGRAVADQPPGVFVDFRSADDVAGRPAVTYREVRAGRVIRWSVVLDRSTRISIGCQSAPGHEDNVRAVCDQAVRSAHEVGTASRG
jgi:type VII secretion-associated protein (TIGR03931 family)